MNNSVLATVAVFTVVSALAAAEGQGVRAASASVVKRHHPDWTGVWVRIGSPSDPQAKPDANPGPESSPTDESDWPPLTPEFRNKYRIITKALERGERLNDPTANCLPAGFPWMMNMPYPMEILQTQSQMTIIAEWMSQTRRVYIGANHQPDPDPTYFGDSTARWDGDTLVVDTVGLRSDTTMNDSGLPHGAHTHVVERWSLERTGILDDQLTVLDPDMLTQPWTRTFKYRREPTFRIMEYVCENNRDALDRSAGQKQLDKLDGDKPAK